MQFLIALDQLLNTLFKGWADETLSARAYRRHAKKTHWYAAMKVIDGIFFWQNRHCRNSYLAEQERRQLPPEYRDEQKEDLLN